ncbi:hypothetical protein [Pelobacter propionicus]|nr:hypothetical protein [Pelobacter propionicus]
MKIIRELIDALTRLETTLIRRRAARRATCAACRMVLNGCRG